MLPERGLSRRRSGGGPLDRGYLSQPRAPSRGPAIWKSLQKLRRLRVPSLAAVPTTPATATAATLAMFRVAASRIAPVREWPHSLVTAARLVTFAVTCLGLYWGQVVLIPIALAALITFLLAPLVTRLDRIGLPRTSSVLLIMVVTAGLIGGAGYVIVGELSELAAELPAHRQNIRSKVRDLRSFMSGGAIENVQSTLEDINGEVLNAAPPPASDDDAPAAEQRSGGRESQRAEEREPVLVQVVPERRLVGRAETWTPALDALATFGLTMLLAIFMLIWREDLRNRLVSLAGATSVVRTTRALEEAGARISRYLRMLFIVNATMGIAVGIGLYFIGVPYAPLWGFAAAILRYIPYIGPWIAAALPITVSLVTAPGWEQVALVVALFTVLELISNNVMEPWLYGQSVGLSALAVIVSAIFWTWLWGPVGLVLATPLTVCLVVLARNIPALAIFDRLLSDRPALESHLVLYQRLLARDEDGAEDIVESYLAEHSMLETCEGLMLGMLLGLKRDADADRVTAEEVEFVVDGLTAMAEDLPAANAEAPKLAVTIMGLPVRGHLDECALHILRALLRSDRCDVEILSADTLLAERVAHVHEQAPAVVCVVSLPPGDLTASRHICKRVKARSPGTTLVVGRLSEDVSPVRSTELLRTAGADAIATTLAELRDAVLGAARAKCAVPPAEPQAAAATEPAAVAPPPSPAGAF